MFDTLVLFFEEYHILIYMDLPLIQAYQLLSCLSHAYSVEISPVALLLLVFHLLVNQIHGLKKQSNITNNAN